ncbi:MAG: GNAT family N-acetyltransferase [Bradymonadaceae bacterium]|nr:GNAT family N-acetyltransferase [Lujinxingiaceae bacterium]
MTYPSDFSFEELTVEDVLPLRTRVLRPHFVPGRMAHFLEDRLPITCHFGIVDSQGEVLAVATFFKHDSPVHPGMPALKLRGMAVDPGHQGLGLGTRMLDSALVRLALRFPECAIIWCYARVAVTHFYERSGFSIWGEEIILGEIGPHFIMWRPMPELVVEDVYPAQLT